MNFFLFPISILLVPLILIAATAPFGATILGFTAISRIRRSAGKLYGLGLALFAALFYPLLLLNALIAGLFLLLARFLTYASSVAGLQAHISWAFFAPVVLVVIVVADILTIRWAWKKVNQPIGQGAVTSATTPTQPGNAAVSALWTVLWHGAVFLLVIGLFVFLVPRFQAIYNEMEFALPPATLLTLKFSNFLKQYALVLFPVVLFLDFGIIYLLQHLGGQTARRWWSALAVTAMVVLMLTAAATLWLPLRAHIAPVSGSRSVQADRRDPKVIEKRLEDAIESRLYHENIRWEALSVLVNSDGSAAEVRANRFLVPDHRGNHNTHQVATNAALIATKLRTHEWLVRGHGQLKQVTLVPDTSLLPGHVPPIPGPRYPLVSEQAEFHGARLADGTVVELVGLSYSPSADRPWWRPDGTLMTEPPYHNDTLAFAIVTQGRTTYEVAYRVIRGFWIVGSKDFEDARRFNAFGNVGTAGVSAFESKGGPPAQNIHAMGVAYPDGTRTADIMIGTAMHPWQTKVTTRPEQPLTKDAPEGYVSIERAERKEGKLWVRATLSTRWNEWNWRFVAVRRDGTTFRFREQNVTDIKEESGSRQRYALECSGVDLADVREIRLEARPFDDATFRNVSLQPGQKTEVEVVVGEPKARADTAITSQPLSQTEQVIAEFDWAKLAAEARLLGGVLVEVDGRKALKIENTSNVRLNQSLLKIDHPPLGSSRYALICEVKSEKVEGNGSLAMVSTFPRVDPGTENLGISTPALSITGTSGWQPFSLSFTPTATKKSPTQLEMKVTLPGRGVVYLGPVRLVMQSSVSGALSANPKPSRDQVIVEDLALRMLAAIRDKDDAALKALAVDRVEGWRDGLPQFAFEMRERFQQMTGKPFAMQYAESLVEGDHAVVKCTGPKELNGTYLVLFFVKTADGWRNWSLRNSSPITFLHEHLMRKPPAAASFNALSFGPVIERVVAGEGDTNKRFIDFDTGNQFTNGSEPGIDAVANMSRSIRGLLGIGMVAVSANRSDWDHLPKSRLDFYLNVQQPSPPATMTGTTELPVTYAIRTREGGMGVLQIVGFTDNPPGVKIRYKLATGTLTPRSSAAAELEATAQRLFRAMLDNDVPTLHSLMVGLPSGWSLEDLKPLRTLANVGWSTNAIEKAARELREIYAADPSQLTNILQTIIQGEFAAVRAHDPHGANQYFYFVFQQVNGEWRVLHADDSAMDRPLAGRLAGISKQAEERRQLLDRAARRRIDMRQCALALRMYADEHRGQWPERLDDAVEKTAEGRPWANHPDFVYRKPDRLEAAKERATVVLFEKEPVLSWGQYVGFADARVEFIIDAARLRELGLAPEESKPSPSGAGQPVTSPPAVAPTNQPGRLQFRWVAEKKDTAPFEEMPDPNDRTGKNTLRVLKEVVLDESAVADAAVTNASDGRLEIAIRFSETGAKRFGEITAANIGRQLAIVFDGQLLTAPIIRSAITGGKAVITGSMTEARAKAIVEALPHSAPPPGTPDAFGPVIERVLTRNELGQPAFIDLESGGLFFPPPTLKGASLNEELRTWALEKCADGTISLRVVNDRVVDGSLKEIDLLTAPATEMAWRTMTPKELQETLNAETAKTGRTIPSLTTLKQRDERGHQVTWLFQTREGTRGMLQILGFTENPRGVKIRYKLVQESLANLVEQVWSVGIPFVDSQIEQAGSPVLVGVASPGANGLWDEKGPGVSAERVSVPGLDLRQGDKPEIFAAARRFGEFYLQRPNRLITLRDTVVAPLLLTVIKTDPTGKEHEFVRQLRVMSRQDIGTQIERRLRNSGTELELAQNLTFALVKPDGSLIIGHVSHVEKDRVDVNFQPVGRVRLLSRPARSENLGFSPAVERVVPLNTPDADRRWCLDLDRDQMLSVPAGLADSGGEKARERWAWIRHNGIDLEVLYRADSCDLTGQDAALLRVAHEQWESLTVAQLQSELENRRVGMDPIRVATNAPPATYCFLTREGGMGVLQIVGFTDNPRGVKIRYKLVQEKKDEDGR